MAAIELSADTLTPVAAALRLRDRLAFILESVEGGARYGRYSFVGVRGRTLIVDGGEAVVWDADYQELERFAEADPLEALRRVLPPSRGGARLPVAAGRRVSATWPTRPRRAGSGCRCRTPIRWASRRPCSTCPSWSSRSTTWPRPRRSRPSTTRTPQARLAAVADRLAHPGAGRGADAARHRTGERPPRPVPPAADPVYEAGVAKLVEDIHAGEMLQVVPARRFAVPNSAPALTIYRALRRINPSPYLFAIDLGPGTLHPGRLAGAAGPGPRRRGRHAATRRHAATLR